MVRKELGLHLQLDAFAGPEFAFHQIYLSKPPKEEEGLTYPKGFKYWKEIAREELPEVEDLLTTLYEIMDGDKGKTEALSCLLPIFDIDLPPKAQNRLLTIVKRLLKLDPEREYTRGICIIPDEGEMFYEEYECSDDLPKAFLPRKAWFSKELQALTIEDVLTILPRHEQTLYALTLGRALIGVDGTIHAKTGREVEHTWRTAPILTGMPGIGKSTITQTLIKAIETTGYQVAQFSSLSKQFGIADIVCKDLAYADDLNEETFKQFINAPLVKQCITGGIVRTEQKYFAEVTSKPTAAFLCNINDFNIGVTYGTDDGVLDRLKILNCRMPTEFDEIKKELTGIAKNSPDLHPVPHLKWLAKELNCSMNALMLRFARLCADYFLEETDNGTLIHTVNAATCELDIQLHKHYEKVIAMVFQLAYILRKPGELISSLPDLKPTLLGRCIMCVNFLINDKAAHWVREEIKNDWKEKDRPSYHPWTGVKLLEIISVDNAAKAYNDSGTAFADKELDKCIKTIYQNIRLNQGYNVPANTAQVIRAWEGSKKQLNALLTLASRVRGNIKPEILEDLTSKREAETSHIRDEDFDRQKFADSMNKGVEYESKQTPPRGSNIIPGTRKKRNKVKT